MAEVDDAPKAHSSPSCMIVACGGGRATQITSFQHFQYISKTCNQRTAISTVRRALTTVSPRRDLIAKRDTRHNPFREPQRARDRNNPANLGSERPSWLADLHRKLDEAVFVAYGWPSSLTDAEVLERLLALNHERAASQG